MTAYELEIQQLRREVAKLKKENAELKHIRQLDMAQIKYLQRQVGFLVESADG